MLTSTVLISSLLLSCAPKLPPENPAGEATVVIIEGQPVEARWDDGDTFSWREAGRKRTARMRGYNTLESYGPVHQWGGWTEAELYTLAKSSARLARSRQWACSLTDGDGGYGRVVVDCPGLRREMLRQGMAHAFWIDEDAPAEDLAVQQRAIARGVGMWEKGSPDGLLTSLHSDHESERAAYNRVCNLQTGMCPKVEHEEDYETCQKVCMQGSCMLYVPFTSRYGDRKAACIQ